MSGQLIKPLTSPLTSPIVGLGGVCYQDVYSLDGADDFGQFDQRLIDPEGDNVIEWEQRNVIQNAGFWRPIIQQTNGTSVFADREFTVVISPDGQLEVRFVGGVCMTPLGLNFSLDGKVKIEIIGSNVLFFFNDILRHTLGITRGAVREPTAPTRLLVDLFSGSLRNFMRGQFFNFRINSTLYPINNPNSPEQRSIPDNGNPLTLVNAKPERWSKIKIPCPKPTQPIVSGVFTSDGLQVFTSDNLNIEVQQ